MAHKVTVCSHQKINAALAIALAAEFEAQAGNASATERAAMLQQGVLPMCYAEGLRQASWPGRCQVTISSWVPVMGRDGCFEDSLTRPYSVESGRKELPTCMMLMIVQKEGMA